jgi:hypothetical protein
MYFSRKSKHVWNVLYSSRNSAVMDSSVIKMSIESSNTFLFFFFNYSPLKAVLTSAGVSFTAAVNGITGKRLLVSHSSSSSSSRKCESTLGDDFFMLA